jgi:prophage maintenance system killer protein
MEENKNTQIEIYRTSDGPELNIKFVGESVWLSLNQIALLFGTQKAAISKHIKNIFNSSELSQKATVSKMETVQNEGKRQIRRQIEFYNLDMVISVGYRVNSARATQFRIWATGRLKEFVVNGYVTNEKRLKENQKNKTKELQRTLKLFQNVIEAQKSEGYEKDLFRIIVDYTSTWTTLLEYDEDRLSSENLSIKQTKFLSVEQVRKIIDRFRVRLKAKKEAGDFFGQEVGGKFEAVLGSIYQTFSSKELYPSLEEKATHLLYFAIKDHPFVDGNKRIGCLLFLLFLVENNLLNNKKGERKINDTTLVAFALLIAESKPQDKDITIKLLINLIK